MYTGNYINCVFLFDQSELGQGKDSGDGNGENGGNQEKDGGCGGKGPKGKDGQGKQDEGKVIWPYNISALQIILE